MTKHVLFLAIGILLFSEVNGQTFREHITDSIYDFGAYRLLNTIDNNFLLIGASRPDGASIIKMDSTGQIPIWSRNYSTDTYYPDTKSAVALPDGRFVISAIMDSINTYGYYMLDSVGNILLAKSFTYLNFHSSSKIIDLKTFGNYLYFLGSDTSGTAEIVKIDFNGNLIWSKTYSLPGCFLTRQGLDIDSRGNLLLLTSNPHCPPGESIFSKLDSSGSVIWSKSLHGIWDFEQINTNKYKNDNIILSADNFYYEFDSSGNYLSFRGYLLGIYQSTYFYCLPNYYVMNVWNAWQVGYTDQDFIIMDTTGNPIWRRSYNPGVIELSYDIISTGDGGILFGGSNLFKIDLNLFSNCVYESRIIDTMNIPTIDTNLLVMSTNASVLINNYTQITIVPFQATVQDICSTVNIMENNEDPIRIFPNPFSNELKIDFAGNVAERTIYLFDAVGRMILNESTHFATAILDCSSLSNGIYFLKIKQDEKLFVRKIMKCNH